MKYKISEIFLIVVVCIVVAIIIDDFYTLYTNNHDVDISEEKNLNPKPIKVLNIKKTIISTNGNNVISVNKPLDENIEKDTIKSFKISENRFADNIKGSYGKNKRTMKSINDNLKILDEYKSTTPVKTIIHTAYTVWYQGKSEGSLGLMRVGSEIYNRLDSSMYPDDLMSVVHQQGEFKAWDGVDFRQTLNVSKDLRYFRQAVSIVIYLDTGLIKTITDVTDSTKNIEKIEDSNIIYTLF